MRTISVDGFNLPRVDLVKIDVEGMELGGAGGRRQFNPGATVRSCLIEALKVDAAKLRTWPEEGEQLQPWCRAESICWRSTKQMNASST